MSHINPFVVFPTFPSQYEGFSSLATLQKSHFVEWFSGKSLRSIWTQTNGSGVNTFAMNDSINGGFGITLASSGTAEGNIAFNGIHHYSNTASVFLFIGTRVSGSAVGHYGGLKKDATNANRDMAVAFDEQDIAFKTLRTGNASSNNDVASAVATDTNSHLYKLILGASNVQMLIDGANLTTNSSTLPSVALQPWWQVQNNGTAAANSCLINYLEVYNL